MSDYDSLKVGSRLFASDVQVIATYTWDLNIDAKYYAHHFVGVEFFSDAEGDTPVTPSGGTYLIEVETKELSGVYQAPGSNSITAATPESVTFAGNPLSIRFTPSTITGAAYFSIKLSSNRT